MGICKILTFVCLILVTNCSMNLEQAGYNSKIRGNIPVQKAYSPQDELFVNASTIDDGGVYFIRSCYDVDYVWDIPNSNYSDDVEPILYHSNGWGNQRFIVHKDTTHYGKGVYTITPLYAQDKFLKIGENDYDNLYLGVDNCHTYNDYYSTKFIIEEGENGYLISTGISSYTKYLCVKNDYLYDGQLIDHRSLGDSLDDEFYEWEFWKTDTLGIDLVNKTYISGTYNLYFNVTPPCLGQFIFETTIFDYSIDTVLELYDTNDNLLARNDDIDGANNRFSRITYNFTSLNDAYILLRGYYTSDVGFVNFTMRPAKPLYFAASYDWDHNNVDHASVLNDCRQYLNGYYLEIQRNRGVNGIIERAPNGHIKMDNEYFTFFGHGDSSISSVEFYHKHSRENMAWSSIPHLNSTKLAIWLSCYSARNFYKSDSNHSLVSMAYQSIFMGAQYSIGFINKVTEATARCFIGNLFEALQTMNVEDATQTAANWTDGDYWWHWLINSEEDDCARHPILYKNGDSIKEECGIGYYGNSQNLFSNDSNDFYKLVDDDGYLYNINDYEKGEINFSHDFIHKHKNNCTYKFVTKFDNCIYVLGAQEQLNDWVYYNLSENKIIDIYTFDKLMGEPVDRIKNFINSKCEI